MPQRGERLHKIMNMSEKSRKEKQGTVYFDGDCPMCRAFVAGIKKTTREDPLDFTDLQQSPLPPGISRESLQKEIHFVDAHGQVYRNVHAVAKILEAQGISRALTTLLKIPGISPMSVVVYRFIARNRYQIFGPRAILFWLKLGAMILLLGILLSYLFLLIVQ